MSEPLPAQDLFQELSLQRYALDIQQLLVPNDIPVLPLHQESGQQSSIVYIDEPSIKVFCHDCRKQINKTMTILHRTHYRCVGCFAKVQPPADSFKVVKSLDFSVIDPNWKAKHQLLFLTFLQKYGFGNWKQIKDQMDFYGAKHSQQQLQNHYYNCYLSTEDFIPKILNNESFFQRRMEMSSNGRLPPNINPTSYASLTTATYRQQSIAQEIDEYYVNNGNLMERDPGFNDYYNDKRNQFEVQYDHDAETLLAYLQFREDDKEEEIAIKFRIIQEYNRRLNKRNQVKKFVLEHRLLQENYQREMDKNRNQYEREAFHQLKPIARLMLLNQYNQLVRKVGFTKQLKSIIQGLRNFRRAHPSNFKSLDQMLNCQPQESKPKKRIHFDQCLKTGKKIEQTFQKRFKLNRRQMQNLIIACQQNGRSAQFKNVIMTIMQRSY